MLDGRRVRRGRIFRSGTLDRVTKQDIALLGDLDIRVICDLRSPQERERVVNCWPEKKRITSSPNDRSSTQSVIAISARYSSAYADHWSQRYKLLENPDFDAHQARIWMLQCYAQMPHEFADCLAELFDHLESYEHPALVHCTAGKDRTGFICAMLLWALGASKETIVSDYMISIQRQPPAHLLQKVQQQFPGKFSERALAAMPIMVGADEELLDTAIRALEESFGSIDSYLEKACGLHPARRQALRSRLLED